MVMLKQTRGRTNGTAFDVGFEEIRYHAVDAAGNKSPECIFFVVVEGSFYIHCVLPNSFVLLFFT